MYTGAISGLAFCWANKEYGMNLALGLLEDVRDGERISSEALWKYSLSWSGKRKWFLPRISNTDVIKLSKIYNHYRMKICGIANIVSGPSSWFSLKNYPIDSGKHKPAYAKPELFPGTPKPEIEIKSLISVVPTDGSVLHELASSSFKAIQVSSHHILWQWIPV